MNEELHSITSHLCVKIPKTNIIIRDESYFQKDGKKGFFSIEGFATIKD